jgi:ribosomal protein S27AE
MSEPRKASEAIIPEIQKCPRCGTNLLIGDMRCSKCGYNTQNVLDGLREQSPMMISSLLFVFGFLFTAPMLVVLINTGGIVESSVAERILAFMGAALIVAGGLYYAADLFILSADQRRRKK